MRLFKAILISLFILSFTIPAEAQMKYERKSISYINALWLATPDARKVDQKKVNVMLESVKEYIEMERFDFNPLPESLLQDFVKAANSRNTLTVQEIAVLMEQKLAPQILEIVRGAMSERGGELVSEEKRQTFLATKAKELGITLEEIEKVMNSAYIYLPVLTSVKREKAKDSDKIIYTIEGGIIWYHVVVNDDGAHVNLRVASNTLSKGYGSEDWAWKSAVKNFARNLETATREIAEFKLSAPISEVDDGNITFKLGKKEGIKKDQCFLVGEWVSYGSEEPSFSRNGWVRIGNVADNRESSVAKSSAWAVKRGSWAPGMLVVEHPRLGIDVSFRPGAYQLKISQGRIPIIGEYLYVTDDYNTMAPGFDLDAQYNIAPLSNVTQLFFLVGGHLALPATLEMQSSWFGALTSSPPLAWGWHVGFMKKYYLNQLAFSAEVTGGMRYLEIQQDFTFGLTDYTYIVKNNTAGVMLNIGLEYAATPDFNIGLMAGYRMLPVSNIWTQEITPDVGGIVSWDDSFPEIDQSGLNFGLYMHWSPPSLPFDPADWLQGALGQ